jgi:hypothetical protein
MLRWVITALVLGTALLGALVYIARPEVIDAQARAVMAPIEQAVKEHEAEKYKEAEDRAYKAWMARFVVTPDCRHPKTALKALECKNKKDQMKVAFERMWQQRIRSGWKPD